MEIFACVTDDNSATEEESHQHTSQKAATAERPANTPSGPLPVSLASFAKQAPGPDGPSFREAELFQGNMRMSPHRNFRRATGKEIGSAFVTEDDHNKLLEFDPNEFKAFEDNTGDDPPPAMEEEPDDTNM